VVDALSPDLFSITPDEEDQVVEILEPLFARLQGERRALLGMPLSDFLKRR